MGFLLCLGMPESFEYPDALADGPARGRGAGLNPGNRYETVRLHVLGEYRDEQARDIEAGADDFDPASSIRHPPSPIRNPPTTVYHDETKSLINRVDSPDLPFGWTINPYRGCEHG